MRGVTCWEAVDLRGALTHRDGRADTPKTWARWPPRDQPRQWTRLLHLWARARANSRRLVTRTPRWRAITSHGLALDVVWRPPRRRLPEPLTTLGRTTPPPGGPAGSWAGPAPPIRHRARHRPHQPPVASSARRSSLSRLPVKGARRWLPANPLYLGEGVDPLSPQSGPPTGPISATASTARPRPGSRPRRTNVRRPHTPGPIAASRTHHHRPHHCRAATNRPVEGRRREPTTAGPAPPAGPGTITMACAREHQEPLCRLPAPVRGAAPPPPGTPRSRRPARALAEMSSAEKGPGRPWSSAAVTRQDALVATSPGLRRDRGDGATSGTSSWSSSSSGGLLTSTSQPRLVHGSSPGATAC